MRLSPHRTAPSVSLPFPMEYRTRSIPSPKTAEGISSACECLLDVGAPTTLEGQVEAQNLFAPKCAALFPIELAHSGIVNSSCSQFVVGSYWRNPKLKVQRCGSVCEDCQSNVLALGRWWCYTKPHSIQIVGCHSTTVLHAI